MRFLTTLSLSGLIAFGLPGMLQSAQQPNPQQPGRQQQPPQQQQPRPQQANPQQPQLQQQRPPAVAATVNGVPVTESEVQSALQSRLRGQRVGPEVTQQVRGQILESLIEARLVEEYALQHGPKADASQIEAILARFEQQLKTQGSSLEQFLALRGIKKEHLERQIQASMAWQQLVAQKTQGEALKQYFEQNRPEFDGTQVQARHILVSAPESAKEAEQQAARQKIEKIRQQLANGADFAQVAQQASDDTTTAPKGGDLGYFPRHGQVAEPFANAAFELKPNEISEPIQTQFGWHLIQVTDRQSGKKQFDEVQQAVANAYKSELWTEAVDTMRPQAKIRIVQPKESRAPEGNAFPRR